jgi:hypothetical protein
MMHYFLLYIVTTPLRVSGSFLAHHQEAECTMRQWYFFLLLKQLSAGPQTVALNVKEVPLPHHTLGLLMMAKN